MELIDYSDNYETIWETICELSPISTIMHTRKYLSYHNDKFQDFSLIIKQKKNTAILPAASTKLNKDSIISHPGISFGGLIHDGFLKGNISIEAFNLICEYYAKKGFKRFIYKSIPNIYHKISHQDDIYSLFRLNAKKIRCDLSCAIDLEKNIKLNNRRKRNLKKALKNNIEISESINYLEEYWKVLINNLSIKYGVKPTHSYKEIKKLQNFFPENIKLVTGLFNGSVTGGVLIYLTKEVCHLQYIAKNKEGLELNVLDLVINYCINKYKNKSFKWLDFGISNEMDGKFLNEGLYQFKSEFGGSGVVHEFYEVNLENFYI